MSLRSCDVFAPPRRPRGRPERAIQNAIIQHLRLRGALVAVTDAGAAYRAGAFFGDAVPAGWPDITGVLPDGRFIGVEVKSATGRQSDAQKHMEQNIRRRNGLYVLARSVDDVENVLAKTARTTKSAETKATTTT